MRGDTLMLTEVHVVTARSAANRCTASSAAIVTEGRTDLTIAVRKPAFSLTFLAGGAFGLLSVVMIIVGAFG